MAAPRRSAGAMFPPATFEDDFGSLLQFLSTTLIFADAIPELDPRIQELVPKMKTWKREFRNSRVKTIKNAAERLIDQIPGMDQSMIRIMRQMQEQSLTCGALGCGVKGADQLTMCAGCTVQRYCDKDHQKADWKYHMHICNKGLVEQE